MIQFKKLSEKEVLEAVAYMVAQSLPDNLKNSDVEVHAEFSEDNDFSVDIHIMQSNEVISS